MPNDSRGPASHFVLKAVAYRFGDEKAASRLAALASEIPPAGLSGLEENTSYHELEPLLHLISTDCEELGHPPPLPEDLRSRWAQAHTTESARCAVIHHGATIAMSALADAGIRAVPLKGYYLSSRFYERKSARGFRDLDLLVEKESLPALDDTLLAAGFRPHPQRPAFVPAPAYTVYSLPLEESEITMEIDIHIGMHWPEEYQKRAALDPEELWSGVSPETLEGLPSWSMSPAHLFITTFLDVAVNHRYARLIKFRDLCEVLSKIELQWEEVISTCRRWKVRSFVGPGVHYLAGMDPALTVPDAALDSLLPAYPLMRLFLNTLPASSIPDHRSRSFSFANLAFFLLADDTRERARGLLHLPGHMLKGRHHKLN